MYLHSVQNFDFLSVSLSPSTQYLHVSSIFVHYKGRFIANLNYFINNSFYLTHLPSSHSVFFQSIFTHGGYLLLASLGAWIQTYVTSLTSRLRSVNMITLTGNKNFPEGIIAYFLVIRHGLGRKRIRRDTDSKGGKIHTVSAS